MRVPEFHLERFQSLHEHNVAINLAESGVDPLTAADLLEEGEVEALLAIPLGYAQTDGPMVLRERIGAHLGAEARNVLVTSATIEANFICSWRLIEPGDEIVYMVPNYLQIGGLVEGFGATVAPFHLDPNAGWQPDLDELASRVGSQTKMIALVNPNNPTGMVLSTEAMERIVELAASVGAWVVVDEIYRGTEHSGGLSPTFWGRYDKVLVTGSLSKAYGLPGLRVGWVIGPEDLLADLWARKDYTSITAASLSYELAAKALEPDVTRRILNRNRELVLRNLSVLRAWTEAHDGLSLAEPAAGAMTLVGYSHEIESAEFADRLLHEKSVLVVPGAHFGLEGYLRIGYGVPTEELERGLTSIAEVLESVPA